MLNSTRLCTMSGFGFGSSQGANPFGSQSNAGGSSAGTGGFGFGGSQTQPSTQGFGGAPSSSFGGTAPFGQPQTPNVQPFGISAHIFILTAALAWSPALAIALSWIGSLLAASVAFVTSRTLARDSIQAWVPDRLRRWDDALENNGLRTVVLLRLLFFTTFLVQLMYGLTKVRYRDYILGTALGNTPQIIIEVLFADWVLAWIT